MIKMFLAAYLLALATTCALLISPVKLLIWLRYRRSALTLSFVLPTLLTVDRHRNWDALTYPHWALGVATYFYYVSTAACLVAIGLAVKSIFDAA